MVTFSKTLFLTEHYCRRYSLQSILHTYFYFRLVISVYLITQARISKYYIKTHKEFSEHEPSRCSSSPANISPKYLKQPRNIPPPNEKI
jgi:hypothetical protein